MTAKKAADTNPVPTEPVATPATPPPYVPAAQPATVTTANSDDTGLATASMVLGIVSLFGFGFLLGIPAIIAGAISMKKKLGGHGMSLAGIITGAISTFLSILFIVFVMILVAWSASRSDPPYTTYPDRQGERMHLYEGDRT